MAPEEFVKLQRQVPFVPFRVTLADGQSYDVVHAQLMMVARDLFIGIPRKGSNQPVFEHQVWIPYQQITKVDMLDPEKALNAK